MSTSTHENPCLVAVALVVKSRAGPRFVFHYPLNPAEDVSSGYSTLRRRSSAKVSSSEDEHEWSHDDISHRPDWDKGHGANERRHRRYRRPQHYRDERDRPASDMDDRDQSQRKDLAWENFLGFGTDGLGTLLCPVRTYHKKRFEMTLDDLVFVGWPVFVREDGAWRKRRETRAKMRNAENSGEEKSGNKIGGRMDMEVNEELEETSGHDTVLEEMGNNGVKGDAPAAPLDPKATVTGKRKDSMTMFNVVFVMSPPALEHQLRVRQMYDNVIKKFSRALKWEQARSDYVWRESKQILKQKEKAKGSSEQAFDPTLC